MSKINKGYYKYINYHSERQHPKGGVEHLTDIHMTHLRRDKVTAVLIKRLLEGRHEFYLPYTLSEINFDGQYRDNCFIVSPENETILDWIDKQKIKYELIPNEGKFECSHLRELYNPEYANILRWLNKKDHQSYPLEYTKNADRGSKITITYWRAPIWLHFTNTTIIDESAINKYNKIEI